MNIMTRAVFSQNPVFNFMNSLRRCIVSRRFTLHSRISRRFYSEETKESQAESSTALRTIVWLAGMGGFFGAAIYFIGSPDKEEDKNNIFGYPVRAWNRISSVFKSFKEPAFEKLLPDQVIDPAHPRPYTLVIDLDKFLVCHMWDPEHSRWRIAKRPGAELFLFYAAQLFEVVVFSSLPQHEGDAVVKKLDPFGCISHCLFRFATTHTDSGVYLKDLSKINRDLSKVVVLGHDHAGFSKQPENFIQTREWNGDPKDRSLEQSIDFLEMLAFSRMADLRPAIKYQAGKIFPDDFEREQAQAFEEARQKNIEMLSKRSDNVIFRLFGLAKSASALAKEHPTYEAKKEERMELRRREFAHLRALMQKQLEAEMEKEKAFYKEHKMALWDLFSKGPPPAPTNGN